MQIQPSLIANFFLAASSIAAARPSAPVSSQRGAQPSEPQRPVERSKEPQDVLEISPQAAAKLAEIESGAKPSNGENSGVGRTSEVGKTSEGKDATASTATADTQLTDEEKQVVEELKQIDREVRAHEQAHLAAAGPYARGGPTYTYEEGPDGHNYAVGGEVQIDTSPVPGDPEATAQKARVIRAAALAPAQPSAQDRAVAAQATQMENQARIEAREQRQRGDAATVSNAVGTSAASGQVAATIVSDLTKNSQSSEHDEREEKSAPTSAGIRVSDFSALGQGFDAVA